MKQPTFFILTLLALSVGCGGGRGGRGLKISGSTISTPSDKKGPPIQPPGSGPEPGPGSGPGPGPGPEPTPPTVIAPPQTVSLRVEGSSAPPVLPNRALPITTWDSTGSSACRLTLDGITLITAGPSGSFILPPLNNATNIPKIFLLGLICTNQAAPTTKETSIALTINPSPIVSITANGELSVPISSGSPVTVAWASQWAQFCTLNGAPVPLVGRQSFLGVAADTDFVLTCTDTNANFSVASATARILPVVSIKANGMAGTITKPDSGDITITWESVGATSCVLPELNARALNGSLRIPNGNIKGRTSYRVSCQNAAGELSDSVMIDVNCSTQVLQTTNVNFGTRQIPRRLGPNGTGSLPPAVQQNPEGNPIFATVPHVADLRDGDLVKVSNVTGYEFFRVRSGYAYGYAVCGTESVFQFTDAGGTIVAPPGFLFSNGAMIKINSSMANLKFQVPVGARQLWGSYPDVGYIDNENTAEWNRNPIAPVTSTGGCHMDITVYGCRNTDGTSGGVPPRGFADQFYHSYNPNNGNNFYTVNYDEHVRVVASGFIDVASSDPFCIHTSPTAAVGTAPVRRIYSPSSRIHYYTANPVEAETLLAAGWTDEGIAGYVANSGVETNSREIFHLYDPSSSAHLYTPTPAVRDSKLQLGWQQHTRLGFSKPCQ